MQQIATEPLQNLRLFDFLTRLAARPHKEDALAAKENGLWRKYSTQEFLDTATNVAHGLLAAGLQKGDAVALIANNRPEWNFVDFGCLMTGILNAPIYPTVSDHDLKFILDDANAKMAIVSTKELYDRVIKIGEELNKTISVYTLNKTEGVPHWGALLELGKNNADIAKLEALKASIKPTDVATLIYTSGTTGNPKGVMLSHLNLTSNIEATYSLAPWNDIKRALSFLPLNHVYERMVSYLYINFGVSIYYAESIETIGDNLKEVHPNMFVTVPRLLEKVYDKIVAKGEELTGVKKALFFWALNLGHRHEQNGANGWWYETQLKLANKLIFNKWREALGGEVIVVASGGAALQERLARVFTAAQIPVLQGYGLTETSPILAVNNYFEGGNRYGTVGPIIENVKIKIAEDGEILAKGPNVMVGYYKRPDLTAEVIDNEGWFHTGDIGEIGKDNFLKITDRKKEIFKTSGGKYIAPQMIENKLKESRFIEQVMVVGENEKFPSAFIVPSFLFLKEYCAIKKIPFTTNADIIKNPIIIKRINEVVEKINKNLAQYEKLKRTELMPQEWSIERDEMTPKMSLKRKKILASNTEAYARIYPTEA
ncbi:MAG: long-chain fatty acid--CoA ligase [Bacteroidia bacterium]|nr:long-chain fatty acid--CoA ligase [Bacteroidia bacterium]